MSDLRNLETIPAGALGLIPLESCKTIGAKVDKYLVDWRETRENAHKNSMAFKGYKRDTYIVKTDVPRFGSGEAKAIIKESVRGYDLFILVDVTNHSLTYSLCGHTNHMSPDVHCTFGYVCLWIGNKIKTVVGKLPYCTLFFNQLANTRLVYRVIIYNFHLLALLIVCILRQLA